MIDNSARNLIVHAALIARELGLPGGVPGRLLETAYALQEKQMRSTVSSFADAVESLAAQNFIFVRHDEKYPSIFSILLTDHGLAYAKDHAEQTNRVPKLITRVISNALAKHKDEYYRPGLRKWSLGELVKCLGDTLPGHGIPHTGPQRDSIQITIFTNSLAQDRSSPVGSVSWDCFDSHDKLWAALRWATELKANCSQTSSSKALEESLDTAIMAMTELAYLTHCEAVQAGIGSQDNEKTWLYHACQRHSNAL